MKQRYLITHEDALWDGYTEYWYISVNTFKNILDYGIHVFYVPYQIKHRVLDSEYNKLIIKDV